MISNTPIVIYTHSDEAFIWKVTIGQILKHASGIDVHFVYNDSFTQIDEVDIPSNWTLHTYDDTTPWTKRVNKVLKEIPSEYVLFVHEDWLLTGDTNDMIIDDMVEFMKAHHVDYLLSYSHYSITDAQQGIDIGYPEYFAYKENGHIMQPAIWKHSVFSEFTDTLNKTKSENEDEDCLTFMRNKSCYSVQNLATVRTIRTMNALFFPHMHALTQNKWHSTKYPKLLPLIESYGIDTSTRSAHPWWELDTQ